MPTESGRESPPPHSAIPQPPPPKKPFARFSSDVVVYTCQRVHTFSLDTERLHLVSWGTKMATFRALTGVHELRFALCQTSAASEGVRHVSGFVKC